MVGYVTYLRTQSQSSRKVRLVKSFDPGTPLIRLILPEHYKGVSEEVHSKACVAKSVINGDLDQGLSILAMDFW